MSAEAFSHSVKAFHRLRYVIVSDIILSERKHNSMNGLLWAAAGTGFTFSMTTLGAAVVFFMRKEGQSEKVQKAFLGFAAGVMIAASVWSLLIPAINEAEALGRIGWIPAAGGFALGVLFLMGLDKAMPYFLPEPEREEGVRRGLKRSGMLIFAITLHNIPEGMAVGLAFALAAHNDSSVLLASAIALAIGMGIQNFPEGAAIALPLRQSGMGRAKAFGLGTLSGIVEPYFSDFLPFLPQVLSNRFFRGFLPFAAGAMLYVVVEELIPEAHLGEGHMGTVGVMLGFLLMMILDVALG